MDSELFVQQLKNYGRCPSDDALSNLLSSCSALQDAPIVLENASSVDVLTCVFKLLEPIQLTQRCLREWKCHCFLVNPSCYHGALGTVAAFAGHEKCGPTLICCGRVISNSHANRSWHTVSSSSIILRTK
jgi:hypothetical protein